MRPEGSIQVRAGMASVPSIYKWFWIASPHIDRAKPSFPFCKLRMNRPASLNSMTSSPMAVMANWWQSVGEGHRFVTPGTIECKTGTKTPPLRKTPLDPAWDLLYLCSVEDFTAAQLSRRHTHHVHMPQTNPPAKARELRVAFLPCAFFSSSWLMLPLLCLPDFSWCANTESCFPGHPPHDDREYRQSSPRGIGRDYEPTVRTPSSSGRVFSEFTGSPSLHAVADFHRGLYLLLLPFQSIRLILILQDAVPVNMPAPPPARAAQAAPHVCSQGHQPPGAVPGRRSGSCAWPSVSFPVPVTGGKASAVTLTCYLLPFPRFPLMWDASGSILPQWPAQYHKRKTRK